MKTSLASAALPIIPAQRSIRPYDYTPPVRRYGDRVLETKSGVLIGGALPGTAFVAGTEEKPQLRMQAATMTQDATAIQAALTHPRPLRPRAIDVARRTMHLFREDPKARALLADLVRASIVRPILRFF